MLTLPQANFCIELFLNTICFNPKWNFCSILLYKGIRFWCYLAGTLEREIQKFRDRQFLPVVWHYQFNVILSSEMTVSREMTLFVTVKIWTLPWVNLVVGYLWSDSQTLTFEQNFADCSHIKPFFGEKFRQRLLAFVVGVVENFRDVIVYLESISKYEFETNMLFRWRKFSCLSPTIRSENSRRRSFKHLN